MLAKILSFFSGRRNRGYLARCLGMVKRINEVCEGYKASGMDEDGIKRKTEEFKGRYAGGESLDSLLPEAYGLVKYAAMRLVGMKGVVCEHELEWKMVHYDVQLIGGIALHEHKIAEMATGEGKTLVATLPLYLNALAGKGCHLVTVNDYLARRDSEWMGYLYRSLGLTVGCIQNWMGSGERREAYNCDITYGTASEFGFDYLRDNGMALRSEDQVQRGHFYVIVDEVDSILIDEARVPLIISGATEMENESPYRELKGGIEKIAGLQARLCNQLATEAKGGFEQGGKAQEEALPKLLQVKMGMPKNKVFMKMMENGGWRKVFERYELDMNGDFNKDKLFEIKEGLYYVIEEKNKQADLTEKGRTALNPRDAEAFVLPDLLTVFAELEKKGLSAEEIQREKLAAEDNFVKRSEEIHCISQLLRAYSLYEADVDYVVQEGKVLIIDPNTGRAMPGRRWSEGLHQAIEAKENLTIERDTKTYATITVQNFFRMYKKLAGMTGTGATESQEFYDIYKLEVVTVPTHRPTNRKNLNDMIFKSRREKYGKIIQDIKEIHGKGQPVLVGTTSVESSELLSRMLRRDGIVHNVLNAKFHAKEADIVAQAGQRGMVTIATNMAGRGTDIMLGEGIAELGGLMVIGTERHESRRIDLQLIGRSARQGDPGCSRFYISLEDDLMRLFANSGVIASILQKTFNEGDVLEHPWLNRSINTAQKRVEQQNYAVRKRLLQYDDVLNKQREVVYGIRNSAIHDEEPRQVIFELVEEELSERLDSLTWTRQGAVDDEQVEIFRHWLTMHFPVMMTKEELLGKGKEALLELCFGKIKAIYEEKEKIEEEGELKNLERYIIIRSMDKHWQDHLTEMEDLRRSVGLRGYGQKDPLNEYKNEAYGYFQAMMKSIRGDICMSMFRSTTNLGNLEKMLARLARNAHASGPGVEEEAGQKRHEKVEKEVEAEPVKGRSLPKIMVKREEPKVGRNDDCPCGSGKKYKKCCGLNSQN